MDKEMRGRRVKLVRCSDPYTLIKPGDLGTVSMLDDMGTLHVKWDNGSNLGLIEGEDRWEWV